MSNRYRLFSAVTAVAPVDLALSSINSITQIADIVLLKGATPRQQAAVAAIVAGFQWSPPDEHEGADDERSLLRALILLMLDEINILRQAAGLAPRTIRQVKNVLQAKIDAGDAG